MDTKVFALSVLLLASCLGTTYQAAGSYGGTVKLRGYGGAGGAGAEPGEEAGAEGNMGDGGPGRSGFRDGFSGEDGGRQKQHSIHRPDQFDYTVQDKLGNTKYQEKQKGDSSGKEGYGYADVDTTYETDTHRFRAIIRTNEPGVGSENQVDGVVMNVDPPLQTVVDKYAQSDGDGGERRSSRAARFVGGAVRGPPFLFASLGAYGGEAGGGGLE